MVDPYPVVSAYGVTQGGVRGTAASKQELRKNLWAMNMVALNEINA